MKIPAGNKIGEKMNQKNRCGFSGCFDGIKCMLEIVGLISIFAIKR